MKTLTQMIEHALALETRFATWAKGPAKTEEEKCERAVTAIQKAIENDPTLSKRKTAVFAQGSYQNRTNIRAESDVDVCVRCDDVFFPAYPEGTTRETFGNQEADYKFVQFKSDVENALVRHFGRAAVTRGNKAFDIHENTYRVDADVVPAFEHRRYTLRADGTHFINYGIEFRPDNGNSIINWPDQNYENGVAKRERTKLRYKKIVRILKNLRCEMQSDGVAQAENVASFLIECLVWNAPDNLFGNPTLATDVESVLRDLILKTSAEASCKEWGEVNELKYLFRAKQPWTREQAHNFLSAAWTYLDF